MKKRLLTAAVWLTLFALFFFAYSMTRNKQPVVFEPITQLEEDIKDEIILNLRVHNNVITVERFSGYTYDTYGILSEAQTNALIEQGVRIQVGEKPESPWVSIIANLLPLIILIALVIYFLRRMNKGGTQNILTLRKSTAKELVEESKVTFADVAGCEEAKELLSDVIDFLKHPEHWKEAGVRLPRGILLEGPPGCGKTLIARAVAGETKAKFFYVSASEFVEMFVGVGAARVRDMFEIATKEAPAVIFIDELDAVGRRRGSGIGASHDEREQTLNQLLVCLDGFLPSQQVVVIGATNRPDILDRALVRPGRFDRRIIIPPLNETARLEALKIHTNGKNLAESVSLQHFAEKTKGLSGSDIENICNEAALRAIRRKKPEEQNGSTEINSDDIEKSIKPLKQRSSKFSKLDVVLIESASQLAEPSGAAIARLHLRDKIILEGHILWADAAFIKLKQNDNSEIVVPKVQVIHIETLAGTEEANPDDITQDPWARARPDTA